ncbi:serine/threonine-protein kinase [Sneathiella aquimaris]|uniref:hypothetical protein n=1 Tax=Sneathiella aquimaris TaxID=2599305 RepID=UPI00146D0F13|nr:hypothetical protein [Sneathiella aquimaris]
MASEKNENSGKNEKQDKTLGMLRGRFKILLMNPLPHMDSGNNKAYAVDDLQNSSAVLYALISDPGTPHREELAQRLTARSAPGMVELHSHGLVSFGPADIRYVFVFDLPVHGRVFSSETGPLKEQDVLNKIVPRVLDTILDFAEREESHRAIRADNLFYMDDNHLGLVLGECVTSPAGSLQPDIYEPLESANSMEYGRGNATVMADIYALGVLIVHLLGGVLPGAGRSRSELYAAKLQHGSYAVLVPKIPASTRVGFLLAGLLNDDPTRRWNVEVLRRWRDGVYERPRPGFGDRRAPGPIVFEEIEYVSPRLLAMALCRRPSQGYVMLENGKLESWVKNSLNDKEAGAQFAEVVSRARNTSRGLRRNEIQAISRAAAILDRQGSLWYRDVTFSRGGMSGLIAYAFQVGGSIKNTLAEILESGLLLDIIYSESGKRSGERKRGEGWMKLGLATECFSFMEKKEQVGFGLERCLYELNSTISCLSTSLGGCHVKDTVQLMDVLEHLALKNNGKIKPYDRHIAAFIAARSKRLFKSVQEVGNEKEGTVEHVYRLVNLFARMQNMMSPGPKPGMCLWVGEVIKPLINSIHSDIRREYVKSKYNQVKESGSIEKILKAVDLKNNLRRDAEEYEQAIKAFVAVENSIGALEGGREYRKRAAQKYGQWIASVISISALLASMGLSYMYFV